MDISEIRLKTSQELIDLLSVFREEFVNMVFENKVTKVANNSRFKYLKKDIARILTVLNQRKGGVGDV